MVSSYDINMGTIKLASDLAFETPIYLYLSNDSKTLLYSDSIVSLLEDPRIIKPLAISDEGISFFLQSGVVPPPKTIYRDIFILTGGYYATVSHGNDNKIIVGFNSEFNFSNKNRPAYDGYKVNEQEILTRLFHAVEKKIDPNKPTYMFHSAGKDSNTIALALAEHGMQNSITLISHKSNGALDESEISKKIAQKLGFKHETLYEADKLGKHQRSLIEDFFIRSPLPCSDTVSLAYPIYTDQISSIIGSNVIDGLGNDTYIGHIPKKSEFNKQRYSKILKHTRILTKHTKSESFFKEIGRTRSECTGLNGLSLFDSKKIHPGSIDVSKHWLKCDTDEDYLDFRAKIHSRTIDTEIHTRKVRNFTDVYKCNLILPWCNELVASHFLSMPEQVLFDRKNLKNKLVLRKILKNRLDLDSDKLGKFGYSNNYKKFVLENWQWVASVVSNVSQWDRIESLEVLERLKNNVSKGKHVGFSGRMIYRIFLLSGWLTLNKYT